MPGLLDRHTQSFDPVLGHNPRQVLGAILLVWFGVLGVPLPLAQGAEHPAFPGRHSSVWSGAVMPLITSVQFYLHGCGMTAWCPCATRGGSQWELGSALCPHVLWREPWPPLTPPQMDGLRVPPSSEALSLFSWLLNKLLRHDMCASCAPVLWSLSTCEGWSWGLAQGPQFPY